RSALESQPPCDLRMPRRRRCAAGPGEAQRGGSPGRDRLSWDARTRTAAARLGSLHAEPGIAERGGPHRADAPGPLAPGRVLGAAATSLVAEAWVGVLSRR